MNAIAIILAAVALVCIGAGVVFTRVWRNRADQAAVRSRLEALFYGDAPSQFQMAGEEPDPSWFVRLEENFKPVSSLRRILERSGFNIKPLEFISGSMFFALAFFVVASFFSLPMIFGAVIAIVVFAIPCMAVAMIADKKRDKFVEQLPDAIDLMISVLRSGLSVQNAIKSAAEEIPRPCGNEFLEVLHRINLGQSLPDALKLTCDRFELFELDLLRRATAIQLELGGSLAELLQKTNDTLRQRIRLKRQVRVLTAQSRLSGTIIALLPFVVATGFYFFNPAYLRPLYETNVGKVFVVCSLLFQFAGILIIRKLSTFKV
jgi:tight adherence protein B